MLLTYTVSNFKSIAKPIEFKMTTTPQKTNSTYFNTLKYGETSIEGLKIEVLKRSMLYGPNKAGNTNFIESIEFAKKLILEPLRYDRKIPIMQYKGAQDETSLFQFTFTLNEKIYEYGFSLDMNRIHEEWLILIEKEKEKTVFTRTTNAAYKTKMTKPEYEHEPLQSFKDDRFMRFMSTQVAPTHKNQLVLSKLAEKKIKIAEDITNWFENIITINENSIQKGMPCKLGNVTEFTKSLATTLNNFEERITTIKIKNKMSMYDLSKQLNLSHDDLRKQTIDEINENILNKKEGIIEINEKMFLFNEDENTQEPILFELQFEHENSDEEQATFNEADELNKTKKLLNLVPMLYNNSNRSNIIIVDDLDKNLNTLRTTKILNQFLKNNQNTNTQLIATMHDAATMTLDDMSNQEIYFLNKSKNGETNIKPLSDYEIPDNYNIQSAYLAGRFGHDLNKER